MCLELVHLRYIELIGHSLAAFKGFWEHEENIYLVWWDKNVTLWAELQALFLGTPGTAGEHLANTIPYGEAWWWQHHAMGAYASQ